MPRTELPWTTNRATRWLLDPVTAYKQAFTETDDPGFGVRNTDGHIVDLMVSERVEALAADLQSPSDADAVIVYGPGAAIPRLCFGDYEFVNEDGGLCTVVQMRWKEG